MNEIKQKITAEIQSAIDENTNHTTIILDDSISDDEVKILVKTLAGNGYNIRTNKSNNKLYINVYWKLEKINNKKEV